MICRLWSDIAQEAIQQAKAGQVVDTVDAETAKLVLENLVHMKVITPHNAHLTTGILVPHALSDIHEALPHSHAQHMSLMPMTSLPAQ